MDGTEFVKKLKPCTFRYKGSLDDGRVHHGFIAQDVSRAADEKIYAFTHKGPDGFYRIDYAEFIGPIVDCLKSIEKRLRDLENDGG